jgi:dTMP kinase
MAGAPGRLIALEGIDGCGKSTQARMLAARLGALLTFEPGATALGTSLRTLVLGADQAAVAPPAEALLMAADRAQHVAEVVRPALDGGSWVVTDRYSASMAAYQGYGRGLDLDELDRLSQWATGGLAADLTVLVEVDPALGQARLDGSPGDRMEQQGVGFLDRVATGYRQLADQQSTAWLVVDGSGPIDEVAAAVWDGVQRRLGRPQ